MSKKRPPYPPEFRRQIIELVRAGRSPEDLAKEFEEKGLKGVGIKLIPRRFYDPALTRYCRHEMFAFVLSVECRWNWTVPRLIRSH